MHAPSGGGGGGGHHHQKLHDELYKKIKGKNNCMVGSVTGNERARPRKKQTTMSLHDLLELYIQQL
jgi:oxalate decarboxylase/phosphoglucose isomerase-like protein (cupin superfamily)